MAIIDPELIRSSFAVTWWEPMKKSFLSIHGPTGIISLSQFILSWSTFILSSFSISGIIDSDFSEMFFEGRLGVFSKVLFV